MIEKAFAKHKIDKKNIENRFDEKKIGGESCTTLLAILSSGHVYSDNYEIKWIAITNFDEWYFFDVKDFVCYFANKLKLLYESLLVKKSLLLLTAVDILLSFV